MGVGNATLLIDQIRLRNAPAAIVTSVNLIAVHQDDVRQFVLFHELLNCGTISFVDIDRDDLDPCDPVYIALTELHASRD